MQKQIKIGDKEYLMKASAYTTFAYKNATGRSLFKDVQELSKLNVSDDIDNQLEIIEPVINLVLDMAYVMIEEADSNQVINKDEFLKSIDSLFNDYNWINDVITLALSPLSRG